MRPTTRQQSITNRPQVSNLLEDTDEQPEPDRIEKSPAVRLGRLLYGGVLGTMAVDGLRNADARAEYADAKGVPVPWLANVYAHLLLLTGAVGIALWRSPRAAATAVVAFFLGVTPMMHDFWTLDDPEQAQQERLNFLKNAGLLGAALIVLGIARRSQ
ncbi:DoxX family protein [Halovivax limisalsi]|uniref:DoxX family protein n=1 Tax=Halovivax limisalsi TaxID=1453760 RepID=UPI001FFDA18A|nr:DoxX family protein [Halovivax limisalsi]